MMMKILRSNTAHNIRPATGLLGLLLVCSALLISDSFAHQQKYAVTRVLFNPSTNNIEVMHRFFVHDAEHAASLIFGERQTLLESADSRQLFSSYVMNRFSIDATYADGSATELELEYVGEELDGQFMWVYQEIPQTDNIVAMTIVNLSLRDVWPDQMNLVNIEKGDAIYSLEFAENTEVLTADLTQQP